MCASAAALCLFFGGRPRGRPLGTFLGQILRLKRIFADFPELTGGS